MGRLFFVWLALFATLVMSPSSPADAAQDEASVSHKDALSAIHAEMNALTLEIENFVIRPKYCKPPEQPNKADHRAQLDELERRANALNQRYVDRKNHVKDDVRNNPRIATGLMLNDIDPSQERWWRPYEAAKRRMGNAMARKKAALAAAPEIDCRRNLTVPQPPKVGTTGPASPPQPPKPPPQPPLPQPPSYDPVSIPTLPPFFCTEQEKLAFLVSISAEMNKANENAKKAGMLKTDTNFDILKYEQAGQPVPPGLRALDQRADAELRAHQAQFDALHRLHQQAAKIPVIDCSKRVPPPLPPRVPEEVHVPPPPVAEPPRSQPPGQDTSTGQAPATGGLNALDIERMENQQRLIGQIEAEIAQLEQLRMAGRCEDVEAKFHRLVNGMIGWLKNVAPPNVVDELRKRARAAAEPCPPGAEPKSVPSTSTALEVLLPLSPVAALLLAKHNEERAAWGLPPLRWDPQLAANALAHAQQLASGQAQGHASRDGRQKTERENLARGLPNASAQTMLQTWLAERPKFKLGVFPDVSLTGDWYDVGHYSQMIWSTTTHVGCGTASGKPWAYLVCRYSPPGNTDGKPVIAERQGKGGGMTQIDPPRTAPPPNPRHEVVSTPPMPQPRHMVGTAAPMPQLRGAPGPENAGGIAPANSATTTAPPPPTARDDAPDGDESRHPLVTYFANAFMTHARAINCDQATSDALLANMRYALRELRKRLKAARQSGSYSGVKPQDVQRQIDQLEQMLRNAEQRRPSGVCPLPAPR